MLFLNAIIINMKITIIKPLILVEAAMPFPVDKDVLQVIICSLGWQRIEGCRMRFFERSPKKYNNKFSIIVYTESRILFPETKVDGISPRWQIEINFNLRYNVRMVGKLGWEKLREEKSFSKLPGDESPNLMTLIPFGSALRKI